MKANAVILFFCLLIFYSSLAQKNKALILEAKRTTGIVKIDGLLDDSAWKDAPLMTNLVEFRPKIGALENLGTRTISYLMYNDQGIYFGGFCYERTKDSIATE